MTLSKIHFNLITLVFWSASPNILTMESTSQSAFFTPSEAPVLSNLNSSISTFIRSSDNKDYLSALLYTAAKKGDTEVVRKLLEEDNININWQDVGQFCPLTASIIEWGKSKDNRPNYIEVIKILLADPRTDINIENYNNSTGKPILIAASLNSLEIVQLLVEKKAKLMCSTEFQNELYSPLSYAVKYLNVEMVYFLTHICSELIEMNTNANKFASFSEWAKSRLASYLSNEYHKDYEPAFKIIQLLAKIEKDSK
jgi:ankyrin repeat protein